uniref:Uncharacterized protein n=1 Tax=Micrurus spixii TaxID=129469 RepID=A0A2D4MNQ6_9SAUR
MGLKFSLTHFGRFCVFSTLPVDQESRTLPVHGLVPGHGMPKTRPCKRMKPHPQDAGSMRIHAPFDLRKKLLPQTRSLEPKRLGAAAVDSLMSINFFKKWLPICLSASADS